MRHYSESALPTDLSEITMLQEYFSSGMNEIAVLRFDEGDVDAMPEGVVFCRRRFRALGKRSWLITMANEKLLCSLS